jgi:hypothetical protein
MTTSRMTRQQLLAAGALAALVAALLLLQKGSEDAGAATATAAKKKGTVIKSDSSLSIKTPNASPRATILCPGKLEPYGGAMSATPGPDREGEGVYPHSYERLGAQSGYHITPVLYDTRPSETRSYQVTLQVVCGKKPGKISDPHAIAESVPSGTSKTLVAKCPRGQVLIGGGFQRAAFEAAGGVYPTESYAISKNQWQTSGTAFGGPVNDLVSIGYCLRSPKSKPLLTTVEASQTVMPGEVARVTTPACPSSRRLVFGGFKTEPLQSMYFADGVFNADQSWTASAFNKNSPTSGAPATLTGYGYCLKSSVTRGSLKKFGKKKG